MDARGNKLSSWKILKKQKNYETFRTLATLALKKEKKKIANTKELLSQL